MNSATYKVAKASDGSCHYAVVSVDVEPSATQSSVDLSPTVFAWLKDVYGPDAWEWRDCDTFRDGARFGAEYALHNRRANNRTEWRVVITKIHASPADTSWDSVAIASCFAVWKAIGDEGTNAPYWEDRKVVFRNRK